MQMPNRNSHDQERYPLHRRMDGYAKEIESKIAAGFYKRVEFSEWASTTHAVTKKSGGIRITGNYKPTVSPQMIIEEHPIPRAGDIFNIMRGATVFARLDVIDAYHTYLSTRDLVTYLN